MASPFHRHTRTGSSGLSNVKKPQNTKAAAQRLAQMMAHQSADDEEEEDDLLYDFEAAPSSGIGLAGARQARNRSPLSVRKSVQPQASARPTPVARASSAVNAVEQQPLSARTQTPVEQQSFSTSTRSSASKPLETPPSHHSSIAGHPFQLVESTIDANLVEQEPLSARSATNLRQSQSKTAEPTQSLSFQTSGRSSQLIDSNEEAQPPSASPYAHGRSTSFNNSVEQPSSARFGSVGRPSLRIKTANMVPPSASQSVKPVAYGTPSDPPSDRSNRDKRLSLDFGTFKYKDPPIGQQSSSALQDELDMLQEENDSLLEKLRLAGERCEEAESRSRQLEKQIASLGEGVSLEARLLSRKEADLQKREVALKVAAETYGGSREEIAALRVEAETARDEAMAALDQAQNFEREVRSLRTVTQRMILTREEMEEVVLKRSWLARAWSLCVRHGILGEIAGARHEYWSEFASRPVEIILAAGKKAKDENSWINSDLEERENALFDMDKIPRKPNVESMLLVEKGLRELTSLKVEEAIAIALAQKRRPNILKSGVTDELKLPTEGAHFLEEFELTPEESEDVLLKQSWLMYFWRRAKIQDLEPDIAEERLQFWINRGSKESLTSHDAVDVGPAATTLDTQGLPSEVDGSIQAGYQLCTVISGLVGLDPHSVVLPQRQALPEYLMERGLAELRKLGIETKLWQASRKQIESESDSSEKTLYEIEYQFLS